MYCTHSLSTLIHLSVVPDSPQSTEAAGHSRRSISEPPRSSSFAAPPLRRQRSLARFRAREWRQKLLIIRRAGAKADNGQRLGVSRQRGRIAAAARGRVRPAAVCRSVVRNRSIGLLAAGTGGSGGADAGGARYTTIAAATHKWDELCASQQTCLESVVSQSRCILLRQARHM